jgi:ergothioneine biosynthesis protein EgtB
MVTQLNTVLPQSLLLERLADARQRTDQLFDIVRAEALYDRPIAERHRIVFYIGHLEAFDWNLLRERLFNAPVLNPKFDQLFAFGIDPVDGGLPTDQPSDWPSLAEVREYVRCTRQAVDLGIEAALAESQASLEFPVDQLLNVAIEHRLMHAETLAYMLHQLPFSRKSPPVRRPLAVVASAKSKTIAIPAGIATVGLPTDDGKFGWDNEFASQPGEVPVFQIDKYKVTNGEYLEFMQAGGYDNPAFWSDVDWKWKSEHKISHPVFWARHGDAWYYRTMFDEVALKLDWPVYVSHAEAGAYARWAGKSLPTEAQWHRAAYGSPEGDERSYPWGEEAPSPKRGNFDFQSWNPTPVSAFPDGQSAFGVTDLLGNGWEWTSSLFAPFSGFKPFPFYRGYSADFFDGKHYVIKGGSPRTAACMVRRSFRNWFQPHYQYVYAGFRCVIN